MGADNEALEVPPYAAAPVEVVRLPGGRPDRDQVAVEEPLEIRIGGRPVAVTMRTPGHDEELALGFCLSEGLRPASARAARRTSPRTPSRSRPPASIQPAAAAELLHVSRRAASAARARSRPSPSKRRRVESDLTRARGSLAALPERLRDAQAAFAATGGLHATGLFDADGELLCLREDVGRHNAMDKVDRLGVRRRPAAARRLDPLRQRPPLVRARAEGGGRRLPDPGRGRRAVEPRGRARAATAGITLCGFVRGGRLNVYTEPWRIADLTGVLLVGGASVALRLAEGARAARRRDARRASRGDTLGQACDERIAVGQGRG